MHQSLRRALALALKDAELGYRQAQDALARDKSNDARARYAEAIATYNKLQEQFQKLTAPWFMGLAGEPLNEVRSSAPLEVESEG
jgi:hypothetical protein